MRLLTSYTLLTLTIPRFITNNPYVQVAVLVVLFVCQFFAFHRLYKQVRLKKWRQLSNTDKFYKVLESSFFSLTFIFLYGVIYVGYSWFILAPGFVYLVFVVPRLEKQIKRIDEILTAGEID